MDNTNTNQVEEAKIVDYCSYEAGKFMLQSAVTIFVSIIIVGILKSEEHVCSQDMIHSPLFYIILEVFLVIPLIIYGLKYIRKGTVKGTINKE